MHRTDDLNYSSRSYTCPVFFKDGEITELSLKFLNNK